MVVCTSASSSPEKGASAPHMLDQARMRGSSSSSACSDTSEKTLVEKDFAAVGKQEILLGSNTEDEVEDIIDTSAKEEYEYVSEAVSQAMACNIGQIVTSCDIEIDLALHKDLQPNFESAVTNAANKCLEWRKVVYNSLVKKIFLSQEQRRDLENDMEVASQLISYAQEVYEDTTLLVKEINRLQSKYLLTPSSTSELASQEIPALSENSVRILIQQCKIYIAEHVEDLRAVKQELEQYRGQIQRFLLLPENSPPEQDVIERAAVLLATFPTLVGSVITGVLYVWGATAAMALIPAGVGIATSCFTALMFVKGVSNFISAERIRQMTDKRKLLIGEPFALVLDSLSKAIDMFGATPPAGSASSGVDIRTFNNASEGLISELQHLQKQLHKQNQHLASLIEKQNKQSDEVKAIRNGQDRLAGDVAPLLRSRTNSTHSNDSGIGRSRPDTPVVAGKAEGASNLKAENESIESHFEKKEANKESFKKAARILRFNLATLPNDAALSPNEINQIFSSLIMQGLQFIKGSESKKTYVQAVKGLAIELKLSPEIKGLLFEEGEQYWLSFRELETCYRKENRTDKKIIEKLCKYANISNSEEKLASA